MQSAHSRLEAEQAEVEAVLSSGVLGRTNNLVRLLTFVCEKYFQGAADEIKEYSIAVNALGRPDSFDPQVDTIVRVSAHALRKRLEDYYRRAGADRVVQIRLPPGHYVPKFIHKNGAESEENHFKLGQTLASHAPNGTPSEGNGSSEAQPPNPSLLVQGAVPKDALEGDTHGESAGKLKSYFGIVKVVVILILSTGVLLLFGWRRASRTSGNEVEAAQARAARAFLDLPGRGLHALAASNRSPYVDRSGASWVSDAFCSGGTSFSAPGHSILGTEDPQLFVSGRRGVFQCKYPVSPGTYEVHLLFAETSGLQENSGNFEFSVNGGPAFVLDVVDDAGGDDIATTKVFKDVVPESDGTIHLDFNTPEAFLNAVEILPGAPHRALPVRIVVGHSSYLDSSGNAWKSDRYFFGGRPSSFGGDLSKLADGRLYEWHRFGHFHYVVPVASGDKYTLKLYFMEHWFGVQNGGRGGVGSRVFDVSCNGLMLLKGFDIFREAGSEPLVKTFPHIEPTPQGKIEIYFTPAVNYPSISAIEVIPE
ncbi:MAG TPA: malectin domain-containing carbohydrate-binding protein [Candidatus Acidoferrum sp.]